MARDRIPDRIRGRVARLLAGDAAAALGDQLLLLVLIQSMVFQTGGDGWRLAALMAAGYVPSLLVAPLCGPLLDRYGGRSWPLCLNFLKAALVIIMVFLIGKPSGNGLILTFFLLERAAGQAYLVAKMVLLPSLTPASGLLSLNALNERVSLAVRIIGPPAAGALAGWSGPQAGLAAAAVLAVAAGTLFGSGPSRHSPTAADSLPQSIKQESLLPFLRTPETVRLCLHWTMVVSGGGLIAYAAPLLVADATQTGGQSVFWLGLLTGAFNSGSLAATWAVSRLTGRLTLERLYRLALTLSALICLALTALDSPPAITAAFLLFGLASQPTGLILITWTQTMAPLHLRGRILALTSGWQASVYLVSALAGAALVKSGGTSLLILPASACFLLAAAWREQLTTATRSQAPNHPVRY